MLSVKYLNEISIENLLSHKVFTAEFVQLWIRRDLKV